MVELHDRIAHDVGHIDQPALLDALRMLAQHQPADVRVQEAPVRVVWITVRFRVLVVDAMVPHPVVDRVLAGDRVAAHQDDAQRQLRLVRPVAPEAVYAARHPEPGTAADEETCSWQTSGGRKEKRNGSEQSGARLRFGNSTIREHGRGKVLRERTSCGGR